MIRTPTSLHNDPHRAVVAYLRPPVMADVADLDSRAARPADSQQVVDAGRSPVRRRFDQCRRLPPIRRAGTGVPQGETGHCIGNRRQPRRIYDIVEIPPGNDRPIDIFRQRRQGRDTLPAAQLRSVFQMREVEVEDCDRWGTIGSASTNDLGGRAIRSPSRASAGTVTARDDRI
mgnify:CR=1 FL=1